MSKSVATSPTSILNSNSSLSELAAQPQSDSDSSLSMPEESRNETVNSKCLREEVSPQINGISQVTLQDLKKELLITTVLSSWKIEKELSKLYPLSNILTDITSLKTQCTEFQRSNTQMDNSITFLYAQLAEMKKQLETERNFYKQKFTVLEEQVKECQPLSRASFIEVRNVPESRYETVSDLINFIQKLGMTLDIRINYHDIRDIYRRGNPEKTKTIVVEFMTVQMKHMILSSTRRFNKNRAIADKLNCEHIGMIGEKRPIYVVEHLSISGSKLFFQARQFSKKCGYQFCWTKNGKIFLRENTNTKFIHVKTEQCLSNLIDLSKI
ncbi:unnamed protein product [Diatraea saccharalis]|uniref:FP protein C-terminal domain-containing protein n=1 Tax=Diatraea saccharalis TaxID=40085 RepID=A0A9N9N1W9_9NEOP|nr:unnamed protein product [Diatraea saccharalis]